MRGVPDMPIGGGDTSANRAQRRPGAPEIAQSIRSLTDEGHSHLIVVSGGPGSGKSTLHRDFGAAAQAADCAVVRAQCSPDETGNIFGVVRQLFEDELARPAEPGAQPVETEAPRPGAAWGEQEMLRAIAKIAVDRPLVILVDDAQWADAASLGLLSYLARRLHKVPARVVITFDANERTPRWPELANLQRQPDTTVWSLGPLRQQQIEELCAREFVLPDEALADACMELTGGVPFLVTELLAEAAAIRRKGEPLAESAQRCVSPNVAAAALARLRRFGPEMTEALGALSVLRTPVRLETAARLLDQDLVTAADTIDLFRRLSLVAVDERVMVSPEYVRRAVLDTLPPSKRHAAEIEAARILGAEGDPDGSAALHLLSSFPTGDPTHVEVLRAGARAALARGKPELAAAFLDRVLIEPLAEDLIGEVRAELGMAELRFDAPSAVIRLRAALGAQASAAANARTALGLAHGLSLTGRFADAVDVLEHELAGTALDPGHQLVDRMRAEIIFSSLGDHDVHLWIRDRYVPKPGATPLLTHERAAGRGATAAPLGLLEALLATRPAVETVRKVADALADGVHPADDPSLSTLTAGIVLVWGDELELAERFFLGAFAEAERDGSPVHASVAQWARGMIHARRGMLPAADRCLVQAKELVADGKWGRWRMAPFMAEASIALARGCSAGLSGNLSEAGIEASPRRSWLGHLMLSYRGQLRVLEEDLQGGLVDLLEAGRRFIHIGCLNPEVSSWRSDAALVLARFGETAEAQRLVVEELELSRAWGTPTALAVALRRRGMLRPGDEGLGEVDEALALLDPDREPLQYARTLMIRARLTDPREQEQARARLARAHEIAVGCDATGLAERIQHGMVAVGGRPRVRTGGSVLTDREQRVAALAASGRTNAEIAKELFITRRTVEVHLTSVYRKLRIRGRSELNGALDRAGARS